MTWLGKILTFLVMCGCVVWAYFTVQSYVTRTNWKAELERVRADRDKAVEQYTAAMRRFEAETDSLKRLLALEQQKTTDLTGTVERLSAAAKASDATLKKMQETYEKGDVQAVLLQANVKGTLEELDGVRKRNSSLEDERVKLIIAREDALKDKIRAENAAKLASGIAEDNARKIEELQARVTELRATGGASGQAAVLRSLDKPPAPLLPNTRGEVYRVAGDLVQITLGLDSGVDKGSVLSMYRLDGGGRYIGTIKVIDVFPKEAIAVFTPARAKVPFAQLRPEELPKKGDEVRPPESLRP